MRDNWLTQFVGRLGFRFALVLAVALLPLAIVSVIRSQSVIQISEARSQAALNGETLKAVSPALAQIKITHGAAIASAAIAPTLTAAGGDVCEEAMRALATKNKFSFVGFYNLEGSVWCSSAGGTIEFGVSDVLRELIENPRVTINVNRDAPVSQTSVIYATAPVYDDDTLIGFASVSSPHSVLGNVTTTIADTAFMTVNAAGEVLTATTDMDIAETLLPRDRETTSFLQNGRSFSTASMNAEDRTYAVVSVVEDQLYALGTWPTVAVGAPGSQGFYLRNPAIFPALMWLASLLVAWFACEILVTRHVRKLRTSMVQFARSRQADPLVDYNQAPAELRDAAEAYAFMTETILHDEAELEDTVRQKDILLREVHHRVKNNLQLIASIMNLQMRQSRSPEVQTLMRGLHDRVMSLSTVHRGLYQTSGLADVRADELLRDIVNQVLRIGSDPDQTMKVQLDLEEVRLAPDQAVPLALLATEALTNALKYIDVGPEGEKRVRFGLHKTGSDTARLVVTNTIAENPLQPDGPMKSGFGSQLLEAFTMQLSGTLDKQKTDGLFSLTLDFEIDDIVQP